MAGFSYLELDRGHWFDRDTNIIFKVFEFCKNGNEISLSEMILNNEIIQIIIRIMDNDES